MRFDAAFALSDEAAFREMPAQAIYAGLPLSVIVSGVGEVGNNLGPGGFAKTSKLRITIKKEDVVSLSIGIGKRITVDGEEWRIGKLNPIGSAVVVDLGPLGDTGGGF
jgi:hypothetical protein